MNTYSTFVFSIFICLSVSASYAQELYDAPKDQQSKWFSFENKTGVKGAGGQENEKAKGHAFNSIKAGTTETLLEATGSGIIQRIWLTFNDRSPEMLRSLRLNMYWDGADKPAVSVPIGDFFGVGLGKRVAFESSVFSDPEGRSFNCVIPMPFRKGAKITLSNDSDKDLIALFYDINMVEKEHGSTAPLYFHAHWNRELLTNLEEDFEILPKVNGKGRFLGTNIGIKTNPLYGKSWRGEGEVKMYIDGDKEYPTLIGTGTEDYIGTAYGQGAFSHQFQGSPIVDEEKGLYAFYRYHIPDPVYFYDDIKVDIQQMGGADIKNVISYVDNGAELKWVTVHDKMDFYKLLEMDKTPDIKDEDFPKGWVNFYRRDDVSATAYFYLDSPVSNLPEIQSLQIRTANLTNKSN
ncbi:glycoside hydrolase family 172 protein [Winogradskyella schleiferi]|uniref:glycoside hydrolase family 172 protein n=1 Tax=Winogradskyella schleiferi TaxID=2686078 RepID=UPI0015BC4BF2|nr:glycoside hydrolase family 172 protein [Winogradskyella schleiferi]